MICGELPFKRKREIVQALVRIKANVSAGCRDLVRKLLEFSPDQRMSLGEITRHPWMMQVEEIPESVPSDDDGMTFHSFTVHRRYYERFLTSTQAYRHWTRVLACRTYPECWNRSVTGINPFAPHWASLLSASPYARWWYRVIDVNSTTSSALWLIHYRHEIAKELSQNHVIF